MAADSTAPAQSLRFGARTWDLWVALLVVVAAHLSIHTLPGADPIRLLMAALVLLFVPGYLALEAIAPAVGRPRWGARTLFALGLTPPLVGLLALAAAATGRFGSDRIALLVTLSSTGCAGVAAARRLLRERRLRRAHQEALTPTNDPGPDRTGPPPTQAGSKTL